MDRRWIGLAAAMALLGTMVVACGGSSDTQPTGGNGGAGTTSTTSGGGMGAMGGGGMGAMGGGGAGAMGGGGHGATGGQGGGQAGAGGSETINGCDVGSATDRTAESTIDLTWSNPHHQCIRIGAGTLVQWSGNFSFHPLAGGVSPTKDPTSAISLATPANGVVGVTFAQAGTYPYFCEVHTASMTGAIYVE